MKSRGWVLAGLLFYCGYSMAGGHHGHGHGYGGGYHGGGHGWQGGGGYHGYSRFGFSFGLPLYGYSYYPYYSYPYSYYAPPTVLTVPSAPPIYIQQAPPVAQEYPAGFWYYCTNPQGYYPYIQACPGGWQQVAPTPPR